MPTKKGGTNIREKFIEEQMTKEKKLSLWLWIGVGGLGILIMFFWGYSIWSDFSSFNWKKTEENKILKQGSSDWNQLFKENETDQLKNEYTRSQLKELLNQTLKQQEKNILITEPTSTIATTTLTTTTIISTTTTNR